MVFNSLGLKIALRLVRSRRKGALTRFISFASTCGIAIGVFAAIVGFSAMNGFEYELQNRVLSVIPSAQLNSSEAYFRNPQDIQGILEQSPKIKASAPVVELKAILSANRAFAPLMLVGVQPEAESKVIDIQRFITGDIRCLNPALAKSLGEVCSLDVSTKDPTGNSDINGVYESKVQRGELDEFPRIIIGSGLARKLKVDIGDSVFVVTLENVKRPNKVSYQTSLDTLSSSLKTPNKTRAIVQGIVHIGGQIDASVAMMDYDVLREISSLEGPNSIHIKTSSFKHTHQIVYDASMGKIKESAYLVTWMNTQGKLYHDIQMVRQIMFVSMFLVLAVACFNIVSNLLMTVGEKRREIAILLTMGMRPRDVVYTFSLMGLLSGAYGSLIGLVLGVVSSLLITPVTASFKEWFGFDLLNEDVYFISFIPCKLELVDVLVVLGCALLMSFLAALYPALRAAKIKPAQELTL